MSHIKLIKTEQDHEQALSRLMALMDNNPEPETDEAHELDLLAVLIEKYELEAFPINKPTPIEAIKYRMEQQKLSNKDLIQYIGSAPKVSEVLSGKRKLSLNMIRNISSGLGISTDILIQAPVQVAGPSSDINSKLFPISEMIKRGYFESVTRPLDELKRCANEELTAFLSSVPNGLNLEPAMLRTTAHLRSNDKETDPYALWAWQVKVIRSADSQTLKADYKEGSIDLEWMQNLANLSWSSQGPSLATEYLSTFGIHLVIEPHLPKTYLDGAVCRTIKGNPVVALTLRHDRLDNFWFSLMHELSHIALHLDGNESWYLDNLDAEGGDCIEQEADAFAQEALIPKDAWETRNILKSNDLKQFAKSLNRSPCIIAGRERFETKSHKKYGQQFRDKVRPHFPNT